MSLKVFTSRLHGVLLVTMLCSCASERKFEHISASPQAVSRMPSLPLASAFDAAESEAAPTTSQRLPSQQPAPTPMLASAIKVDSPWMTFKATFPKEWFHNMKWSFTTRNLPAISSDGQSVLVPFIEERGISKQPNLVMHVFDVATSKIKSTVEILTQSEGSAAADEPHSFLREQKLAKIVEARVQRFTRVFEPQSWRALEPCASSSTPIGAHELMNLTANPVHSCTGGMKVLYAKQTIKMLGPERKTLFSKHDSSWNKPPYDVNHNSKEPIWTFFHDYVARVWLDIKTKTIVAHLRFTLLTLGDWGWTAQENVVARWTP